MRGSTRSEATGSRVELYVRSLSPDDGRGPQSAVLEELRHLDEVGRVDELSVTVWGRQVGLSTTAARTDAGEAILETIAGFRSWAAQHDRSLDPFLRTQETTSQITGESHTAIVLPTMLLAEYRDDSVTHVAPNARDGSIETVADRLEALQRRDRRHEGNDPGLVSQ